MSKVSVIIPTYNRADYVSKAIDSVLNQSFDNFEIVVVDDGSTDNTREVLRKYSKEIKSIYQTNKGVSAARNVGIIASKGDYIAFLDSDDLWLSNKLELQTKFLDDNPEIGMVYSNVCYFNNMRILKRAYFKIAKPYSGRVLKWLFLENFIPNSTVIVRRNCFKIIGLFDESLSFAEDYDMWLRIAQHFKIGFIDKALAMHRVHENRATKNIDDTKQYLDMAKVLSKISDSAPLLKHELGSFVNKKIATLYFRVGCTLLKQDKYVDARKNLLHSIKHYPFIFRKYIFLLFSYLPPMIVRKFKRYNRYIKNKVK